MVWRVGLIAMDHPAGGTRSATEGVRRAKLYVNVLGQGGWMTAYGLQLEVLAGGDPLRAERLTRDLQEVLHSNQALAAAGISIITAPPAPPRSGAKGTFETVLTLLAAAAPYAQPAADVLTSAIRQWCSGTDESRFGFGTETVALTALAI